VLPPPDEHYADRGARQVLPCDGPQSESACDTLLVEDPRRSQSLTEPRAERIAGRRRGRAANQ
jgi:hypothetical protein